MVCLINRNKNIRVINIYYKNEFKQNEYYKPLFIYYF